MEHSERDLGPSGPAPAYRNEETCPEQAKRLSWSQAGRWWPSRGRTCPPLSSRARSCTLSCGSKARTPSEETCAVAVAGFRPSVLETWEPLLRHHPAHAPTPSRQSWLQGPRRLALCLRPQREGGLRPSACRKCQYPRPKSHRSEHLDVLNS